MLINVVLARSPYVSTYHQPAESSNAFPTRIALDKLMNFLLRIFGPDVSIEMTTETSVQSDGATFLAFSHHFILNCKLVILSQTSFLISEVIFLWNPQIMIRFLFISIWFGPVVLQWYVIDASLIRPVTFFWKPQIWYNCYLLEFASGLQLSSRG